MVAMEQTQLKELEPLIYDLSSEGRIGVNLPECDVPLSPLQQA
jgi:hypothetical protein